MTQDNNKRIAKNTIFLSIRMLLTLGVMLYTSRVILSILGVEDFGIYNVVGGVVSMFMFISSTMATASQRFFAFEIGREDHEQLRKTFSVTVSIYLIFAAGILILAETVGLWFVKTQLNIPLERQTAAMWVYQLSVLSFIVNILRIPYNAAIIAHEKMAFFAWISVIEAILKLAILVFLVWLKMDKLILFAVLMFVVIFIVTVIFYLYCRIKFAESRYEHVWDKALFSSMFSYAGWNLFDSLANVGMNQGVNILLNIFFGPAVNAARAIAFQINSQVAAFVMNFQIAASPQITKYYATGEKDQMKKLLFQSSRWSYYLLFLIALPVVIEMDTILSFWLKEVPEYTALFSRLVIVNTLVNCLSGTTIPAVEATGKIKYFNIFVGTTMLLNLPFSYLFLKLGYPAETTMIISSVISAITLFIRLVIVKSLLGFGVLEYLNEVVKYNIYITILSSIIPVYFFYTLDHGLLSFFVICSICVVTSFATIYFLGFKDNERRFIVNVVISKVQFLKSLKGAK